MNRLQMALAAGVAATFVSGAALAQQAAPAAMNPNPPADVNAASPNGASPNNAATGQAAAAATMGVDTNAVTSNTAPAPQVQALAQGDNTMVTNGPVPDTPANRALYRPLSHAGRVSKPAGN